MNLNLDDLMSAPVAPRELDFGTAAGGRPWSPMQIAIYKAINDASENILVQAVAGSGKTTTIVHGLRFTSPREVIAFLAFNKAIADELASRVPSHVQAKTFHAFGLAALRRGGWKGDIDGRKMRNICNGLLPENARGGEADLDYGEIIIKLCSTAKSRALFFDEDPTPVDMAAIFDDLDLEEGEFKRQTIVAWAARAFRVSANITDVIDFDDMLWLPFRLKTPWPQFDRVFVDEVQDLNRLQHEIIAKLGAKQIVCVGDRAQSIYAFRGATPSSMDDLKLRFAMRELPLSVTYRCPAKVVQLAREWVPHLSAREGAPEGQVIVEHEIPTELSYFFQNGARHEPLIICRQNKPLIKLGLRMLAEQRQFTIRSNLEGSITYFVDTLSKKKNGMPIDEFVAKLAEWFKETEKSCYDQGRMGALAAAQDRFDALTALCEDVMVVDVMSLKRLIAQLFKGKDGPLLCTIHKSKGLEADEVIILRPDLIPSRFAKTEVDIIQENNLLYVARTRAKSILTLMYDADEMA